MAVIWVRAGRLALSPTIVSTRLIPVSAAQMRMPNMTRLRGFLPKYFLLLLLQTTLSLQRQLGFLICFLARLMKRQKVRPIVRRKNGCGAMLAQPARY